MNLIRSLSLPEKLNDIVHQHKPLKISSFNNFELLNLKGNEKHLSYGVYCIKKQTNKINRKKVISYFYKNLSKL